MEENVDMVYIGLLLLSATVLKSSTAKDLSWNDFEWRASVSIQVCSLSAKCACGARVCGSHTQESVRSMILAE